MSLHADRGALIISNDLEQVGLFGKVTKGINAEIVLSLQ